MRLLHILLILMCRGTLFSQATLPTYCTDFNAALPAGWTMNTTVTNPTHDDCNGDANRFNANSHVLTVHYSSAATTIKYSIARNGATSKTLVLEESPDGVTWTGLTAWTEVNTPTSPTMQSHALNSLSRYVRFNMTSCAGGRMEIDIVQVYNTTPAAASAGCRVLPVNCLSGIPICSDQNLSGNSSNFGIQELSSGNHGCLNTNEHQSSWYYFEPITSGTLEFTLTPSASIDYDFAIWTGTCDALGTPVRCSYSDNNAPTGLTAGSGDNTENANGNGFVNALPIVAGQTYIMLIDNFTADNTAFTLDLMLSGGATLDCTPTPLPIQLMNFEGAAEYGHNLITWRTYSEENNDYFRLERSIDGITWGTASKQPGAGFSSSVLEYSYEDYDFRRDTINYYRLSQTDYNGESETFQVIAIDNSTEPHIVVRVINLLGQELPIDSKGTVILIYEDGTSELAMRM